MVDYSKWQNIELSSDEDDVHPFIETSTLFKLKHESRLKKIDDRKKAQFSHDCHKASWLKRYDETLKNHQNEAVETVQCQLQELETEKQELLREENELKKDLPWYIDTICRPGFSKTCVTSSLLEYSKAPEDYSTFHEKYKIHLKQFASLKTFDDVKKFLLIHQHLIQRATLYFLVSRGIKFHIKEQTDELKFVCRQIVLLLHVLELFRIFKQNSKELLTSFFSSIHAAEQRFKDEFDSECKKVEKLIKTFIKDKHPECENNNGENRDQSQHATQDESKSMEVFNSLPEDLQKAFIKEDKNALAEALSKLPLNEAEKYMQQCVEVGLWIPEEENAKNSCS